eukprot:7981653-Pyramimonas_sp.AAC.2
MMDQSDIGDRAYSHDGPITNPAPPRSGRSVRLSHERAKHAPARWRCVPTTIHILGVLDGQVGGIAGLGADEDQQHRVTVVLRLCCQCIPIVLPLC